MDQLDVNLSALRTALIERQRVKFLPATSARSATSAISAISASNPSTYPETEAIERPAKLPVSAQPRGWFYRLFGG